MKCFYHSADLDGHCSGAIVKHFRPECELYPINYGQEFPWEQIGYKEEVYMVDFSLQPFIGMVKLHEVADLIWIDHHKTALDEAEKSGLKFNGIQHDGIGACQLTWEFFQPPVPFEKDVPYAVQMLAQYDVWNHSDKWTLPFQYGLRLKDTSPENNILWHDLFVGGVDAVRPYVEAGKTVLEYEAQTNVKFCKAYAFETTMPDRSPTISVEYVRALKAICVNKGFTNSKVFDSVWNPDKYDLMITFCRLPLPKKQWTISLYSTKEDVDCGAIAKLFGGGGHKGAAGFQCNELPFDY